MTDKYPADTFLTPTDLPLALTPPRPDVTTWRVEERTHGLKRWQVARHESGPGCSSVTTWRFAERYQAERYAIDVLGVPGEHIIARGGAA